MAPPLPLPAPRAERLPEMCVEEASMPMLPPVPLAPVALAEMAASGAMLTAREACTETVPPPPVPLASTLAPLASRM